MKKLNKIIRNIFIIIVLLFVIASVIVHINDNQRKPNENITFNTSWNVNDGIEDYKVDFPFTVGYKENNTYYYEKSINVSAKTNVCAIATSFSIFEVYLDDKLIYTKNDPMFYQYENRFSNKLYLIDLPDNIQDETLKFVFHTTNNEKLNYTVKECIIGNYDSVVKQLFFGQKYYFIISLLTLFFGVIAFILMYLVGKNEKKFIQDLLCIGLYSVLAFIYTFSGLDLTQIIISDDSLINILLYGSLLLLPVPLIVLFFKYISKKSRTLLILTVMALIVNFIVQTILLIFNVSDYPNMVNIFHTIAFAFFFVLVIIAFIDRKNYQK